MYNQEVCGAIDVCTVCNSTVEKMFGIEVKTDSHIINGGFVGF